MCVGGCGLGFWGWVGSRVGFWVCRVFWVVGIMLCRLVVSEVDSGGSGEEVVGLLVGGEVGRIWVG